MSNTKDTQPIEGKTYKEQSGKLRERMADLLQDNKELREQLTKEHPKYFPSNSNQLPQ